MKVMLAGGSLVAALVGCSGAASPPPAEPAAELVIPPLAPDAGVAEAAPVETPTGPAAEPSETLSIRDARMLSRRPRSRALVQAEVTQLEHLFSSFAAGSAPRGDMLRRIAEDYCELAASASGPDADHLRDEAIKRYVELETITTYAKLDEVEYYLGLAYEQNGDKTKARRSYYELIAHHPSSRLIALAYFAFAEMFFAEGAADPSKNDLARQAYQEVLKYPPATNPAYEAATRRLADLKRR